MASPEPGAEAETALFDPGNRPLETVTAGPGRVAYAGLQQSNPTRDPNFDPRKETICFLRALLDTKRYRERSTDRI